MSNNSESISERARRNAGGERREARGRIQNGERRELRLGSEGGGGLCTASAGVVFHSVPPAISAKSERRRCARALLFK